MALKAILEAKRTAGLQSVNSMEIKEGLSRVKHLACPLVVPPQATCCHPATQNCDKPWHSELWC